MLAILAASLGTAVSPADAEADVLAHSGEYVTEIDGQVAGYLVVREEPAPACVRANRPLQLWRLCVDPKQHGSGVARNLMAKGYSHAQARGHDVLWLGVEPTNARAYAFYVKCGFRAVGTAALYPDEPPDFILSCSLG